jgi:hypothetical protein
VIADEIDLSLRPGEGEMIGGVARRGHRFQRPAGAFDHVAVLHRKVRLEIAVGTRFRIVLLALEARPRGAMRPLGINRGASRRLDPRRVRRVVAVSMGDENMRHGLATHRIQQRLGMRLVVGAGIDDRNLALAHDVADGAGERERARIVAEHPPHAGPGFLGDTRLEREIAVERDVVVIGHGGSARVFQILFDVVMPGLDPGIHVFLCEPKTWMAGTSPAMTELGVVPPQTR